MPPSLPIHLDEVAYQVSTGSADNVPTVSESTQATYYAQIVNQVNCDSEVASLSFFHFVDEPGVSGFQSGFLDANLNKRAVFDSVKAAVGRPCTGGAASWSPDMGVVGFKGNFTTNGKIAVGAGTGFYGFAPTAEEDATYKAGVFPAGTNLADAARSLAAAVTPILTATGSLGAYLQPPVKFALTGRNGSFVYAVTVKSVTSPSRTETVISAPFTVGTGATTTTTTRGTALPYLLAGPNHLTLEGAGPHATGRVRRALTAGTTIHATRGSWSRAASYAYAWKRCNAAGAACVTIPGQTGLAYQLGAPDVGSKIRFEVTATNGAGSTVATTDATTIVTADTHGALPALVAGAANRPAITVGGPERTTLPVGTSLTGSHGTWTNSPTFAYAWQRCNASGGACTAIPGQTHLSYGLVAADAGHTIRFTVTATTSAGSATATTDATHVVTGAGAGSSIAVVPLLLGSNKPTVTANNPGDETRYPPFTVGSRLLGSRGHWTGADSYALAWKRCNAAGSACTIIAGRSSSIYTLVAADAGATLVLEVTAGNAAGHTTADSVATPVIAAIAGKPGLVAGSKPTIRGKQTRGSRLYESGSDVAVVVLGSWTGSPTFAKAWQRCNAAGEACTTIAGQTDTTYSLVTADVGSTIRLAVTATNSVGSTVASSDATPVITAGNAASVVPELVPGVANRPAITVSGPARTTFPVGTSLTGTPGTWTGSPTFTYAWKRCNASGGACTTIVGHISHFYEISTADIGSTIRLEVTARNGAGPNTATSDQTSVVSSATPSTRDLTLKPTLSTGSAVTIAPVTPGAAHPAYEADSTLNGSRGEWTGSPTFAYAWQRCNAEGKACVALAGQDLPHYFLRTADVGFTIRFVVTATNSGGSTTAISAFTPVITATADKPKLLTGANLPALRASETGRTGGVYRPGGGLIAHNGSWSGSPRFAFSWQRCNASGAACTTIAGETDDTYAIATADVGSTMRFVVTATNAVGSTEATTDPSPVITASTATDAPRLVSTTLNQPSVRPASHIKVDTEVTASPGAWTQLPTFTYAWERCTTTHCAPISGATGKTYIAVTADVGFTLRVRVTATNPKGSHNATSGLTEPVTAH